MITPFFLKRYGIFAFVLLAAAHHLPLRANNWLSNDRIAAILSLSAVDDTASCAAAGTAIAVLNNDIGDALAIVGATPPKNGVVSIGDNQIIYTPNVGFAGKDIFVYEVRNGNNELARASVFVEVAAQKTFKVKDLVNCDAVSSTGIYAVAVISEGGQAPYTISGDYNDTNDTGKFIFEMPDSPIGYEVTVTDGNGQSITLHKKTIIAPCINSMPIDLD